MKLTSDSFTDGSRIPDDYAFAVYDAASHVRLSDNKNPHLAWSDLPDGTKSIAVVCCDPDVPSRPDSVNREGVTVPIDLPRVDFYHWAIIDLEPSSAIASGEFSAGVTPRGKQGPAGPRGTRQGLNNYTQWFEGDADMAGQYYGYDGPCPPWNDERVHHYVFTAYALDIAQLPLTGSFAGVDVVNAVKDHVLAQASMTATFSIFPQARVAG